MVSSTVDSSTVVSSTVLLKSCGLKYCGLKYCGLKYIVGPNYRQLGLLWASNRPAVTDERPSCALFVPFLDDLPAVTRSTILICGNAALPVILRVFMFEGLFPLQGKRL